MGSSWRSLAGFWVVDLVWAEVVQVLTNSLTPRFTDGHQKEAKCLGRTFVTGMGRGKAGLLLQQVYEGKTKKADCNS